MSVQLSLVGPLAAEIDRIVVRGHELAGDYADKPDAVKRLKAHPALLNTAAIVLLDGDLTRAEICAIVPYTPPTLIDALIDNNVAEGIVSEASGRVSLTDEGRVVAEGVVHVHEAVMASAWKSSDDEVRTADELLTPVVAHGTTLEPLALPSDFALFAAVCDRPTPSSRVLRLMTAVRYWRADAHRRAHADADLNASEAHALNRLWDAHRSVDRPGQGHPEPGSKGVASLEVRGLASSGAIHADGIALRERIEQETDRLTAPIYEPLDDAALGHLLEALESLPA